MEGWAKIVADEGKATYANPTTGKYLADAGSRANTNWEEYSALKTCVRNK